MKVMEMTSDSFWKGEEMVTGVVEESGRRYRTRLNLRNNMVSDYDCTCGRTKEGTKGGMCVHCRSLLEASRARAGNAGAGLAVTSQSGRAMIREYTEQEVNAAAREGETSFVKLVPVLILGKEQVQLEFRLECGRSYPVRDLESFFEAVELGEERSYGKRLTFYHNRNSFLPECRPLAEFVRGLVDCKRINVSKYRKSSSYSDHSLQRLNLSRSNLDQFFSIMSGEPLEIREAGSCRIVAVVKENPKTEVLIGREGFRGLRVSVVKPPVCFQGDAHLYLVDERTLYCCDEAYTRDMSIFFNLILKERNPAGTVTVSERDAPLFYMRVFQKIKDHCTVRLHGLNIKELEPPPLTARFTFDLGECGDVMMRPELSYGDFSFHPVDDGKIPGTVCRDVPGEYKVSRLILDYFKHRDGEEGVLVIPASDEEAIYRLLDQGIEKFSAAGSVILTREFQKLEVLPPAKLSLKIKSLGDWLELSVNWGGMEGQDVDRILEGYAAGKKSCRLGNGAFLKLSGAMEEIRELAGELGVKQEQLKSPFLMPRHRALYLDCLLREQNAVSALADLPFQSLIGGLTFSKKRDFEIPGELEGELLEYQKDGFCWMKTLDSLGFGGILADDMGLGKTVQVIALLSDLKEREPGKPSLVVCPASLIYNWENEIRSFAPSLNVQLVTGTSEARDERLRRAGDFDVIVTSYDLLKRDAGGYREMEFRYLIIDEAQNIKNASTQAAKAVKSICAQTKFALTGTPVENRLSELWSIFDCLMPGLLFHYSGFKKKFENPITRDNDGKALKRLRMITGPFILRRMKKDVMSELPKKLENVIFTGLSGEQALLYGAASSRLRARLESTHGEIAPAEKIQILSELTRLRQICCDPRLCYEGYGGNSAKLETCLDLVSDGVEGGHKVLIFSQFTSMLDLIAAALTERGIGYSMLTGSTPKEQRIQLVREYQEGSVPVFLISLRAGGTGLNLTAADVVIHYDPWWNEAVQDQATDRAHRIGQERNVTVCRLIVKGTVEEGILKLQRAKRELADHIIRAGVMSIGSLDKKDLIELLR